MTFILVKLTSLEALAEHAVETIIGTHRSYTSASNLLDPDWGVGIVISYYYVDLRTFTSSSGGQVRQLRTRMFGSREDPATGSAASALCGDLALIEGESQKFEVVQGVEMGRRSEIGVEVVLDEDRRDVKDLVLSGTAVKVMEGTLEVPEVPD
ncbi:hypothetical protein LTR66_017120, partial [Elasticomyces elasticus]